jgi:hypothetical protein
MLALEQDLIDNCQDVLMYSDHYLPRGWRSRHVRGAPHERDTPALSGALVRRASPLTANFFKFAASPEQIHFDMVRASSRGHRRPRRRQHGAPPRFPNV